MIEKLKEKAIKEKLGWALDTFKNEGDYRGLTTIDNIMAFVISEIDSMIESAKDRVNKAFEEKNKDRLLAMIQSNNNVFSRYFLSKLTNINLPLDKNQKLWLENVKNIKF